MTVNSPSKVAIVTGAARGIGLAVTEKFLDHDYAVAMVDIDADTLSSASTALKTSHPSAVLALHGDVADPESVQSVVETVVTQFGHLDALVNNAGIAVFAPLLETSFEQWSRVMAVNLNGPFLYTQACAPHMIAGGSGCIVNIASISGLRASLLRVAYGTSKAALEHLSRQQAAELGNVGVRVNTVAPGPIDTAMAKQVHTADIRADYHDAIPMNRYGTEQEIANAVFFLCSDEASYINGQTLAVDGGFDATGIGLASLRTKQES